MTNPTIEVTIKRGTKATPIVRINGQWPQKMTVNQVMQLIADGAELTESSKAIVAGLQTMSPAQRMRQNYRDRSGKYDVVNECQCCKGKVGVEYYSDPRTDTVDSAGNHWADSALVLCGRCSGELEQLPDAEAYAIVTGSAPRPWARKPRKAAK